MKFRNASGLVFVSFLFGGCFLQVPIKEGVEAQPKSASKVEAEPPPSRLTAAIEANLLAEAEADFRAKRLLPNKHKKNAYDRFHSVLILNPSNARARSGLQAILLSSSENVRKLIRIDRFTQAQKRLNNLELYFPANELILDLKRELKKQKQRYYEEQQRAQKKIVNAGEQKVSDDQFILPVNGLKSDKTIALLNEIAQRLKSSDETIFIYARNDAEGRWIYKKLRDAVPGYRVRGDIRYSDRPRIKILPPI